MVVRVVQVVCVSALALALLSVAAVGCSLSTQGLDYGKEEGAGGGTASSGGPASSSSGGSGSSGGTPGACDPGFECVPKVAAGMYARRAMMASEGCPAGWTPSGDVSDGTDPGCAPCSCAPAAGGACVSGSMHRWDNTTCTMNEKNYAVVTGQCIPVVAGAGGYAIDAPQVLQGACVPSAGDEKAIEGRAVCTFDPSAAAPCGDAGVCVPVGGGSFGDVCNLLPAASQCATGWGQKEFLYGGFVDTRKCGCVCSSPSGGTCADAGGTLYSGPNCTVNDVLTVKAGVGCVNTSGASAAVSMKISGGQWAGGTCTPSPKENGAVMFTDAMVLCCP